MTRTLAAALLLLLSGCAALSVPPATVNHVSAGQRTLMFENYSVTAQHWTY